MFRNLESQQTDLGLETLLGQVLQRFSTDRSIHWIIFKMEVIINTVRNAEQKFFLPNFWIFLDRMFSHLLKIRKEVFVALAQVI